MNPEARDISDEDSRTAALGRKRTREQSEEEHSGYIALDSEVSPSRHISAKRPRIGNGNQWVAASTHTPTDSIPESLSVPVDHLDRDVYAELPHESERLLANLGQQSDTTSSTQILRQSPQRELLPLSSSDVKEVDLGERNATHLISTHDELPAESENSTNNTSHPQPGDKQPGEDNNTVSRLQVTDEDRAAILKREKKRTKKQISHIDTEDSNNANIAIHVDSSTILPKRALEYHIARYALKGLRRIYYPVKGPQPGDVVKESYHALLCYEANTSESVISKLQSRFLVIDGEKKSITAKQVSSCVKEEWHIPEDFWDRFVQVRVDAVVDRLQDGELDRQDYGALRASEGSQKKLKKKAEKEPAIISDNHLGPGLAIPSLEDDVPGLDDLSRATDSNLLHVMIQARYPFLISKNGASRCQMCIQEGHETNACPSRTCTYCQQRDEHFSNACPTQWKCTRCRQLGHLNGNCTSNRTLSFKEGKCERCQSEGHVEDQCSLIWRTFFPENIYNPNKVENLVQSCYSCASAAHWGNDCPLIKLSPRHIWSTFSSTFSKKEASQLLRSPKVADMTNGISIKGAAGAIGGAALDLLEDVLKDEDPSEPMPSTGSENLFQEAYRDRSEQAALKTGVNVHEALNNPIIQQSNENINGEGLSSSIMLQDYQESNGNIYSEAANGAIGHSNELNNFNLPPLVKNNTAAKVKAKKNAKKEKDTQQSNDNSKGSGANMQPLGMHFMPTDAANAPNAVNPVTPAIPTAPAAMVAAANTAPRKAKQTKAEKKRGKRRAEAGTDEAGARTLPGEAKVENTKAQTKKQRKRARKKAEAARKGAEAARQERLVSLESGVQTRAMTRRPRRQAG